MSEDQTRADAAVVECRTQLVQFQQGPLAFVKKTISERLIAARQQQQQQRLSFAAVNRLRTSFLSRKKEALKRAKSTGVDLVVSTLPTPARDSLP